MKAKLHSKEINLCSSLKREKWRDFRTLRGLSSSILPHQPQKTWLQTRLLDYPVCKQHVSQHLPFTWEKPTKAQKKLRFQRERKVWAFGGHWHFRPPTHFSREKQMNSNNNERMSAIAFFPAATGWETKFKLSSAKGKERGSRRFGCIKASPPWPLAPARLQDTALRLGSALLRWIGRWKTTSR